MEVVDARVLPSYNNDSLPSFNLGIEEHALNGLVNVDESDLFVSNDDLECLFRSLDTVVAALEALISDGASGAIAVTIQDESFLPRDPSFEKALEEGGENPSVNVDKWALNRLRKFREFIGDNSSIELVDMLPSEASNLLCRFFEQVKKENKELYPPPTLMSLLRAYNHVFCKAQQSRVVRIGVDEVVFCMKKSPLFRRVCVACVLAMKRSKELGLGVKRKKAAIVSLKDEETVLASDYMATTNSRGLLRRCAHYYLFRFGIRGGSELHSLKAPDFVVSNDDKGEYVQYDERISKNYRVTLQKTEHFRPVVKCHEVDVVVTFRKYLVHRPPNICELFLTPIDNPRGDVWYSRTVVGAKQLTNLVKQSFKEAGIQEDVGSSSTVSNRSGRSTLITQMAESGVPTKVGMLILGHKSKGAYNRYDRSGETRVRAAQCCIESKTSYSSALQEENSNMKLNVIDGKENACESPMRVKLADRPAVCEPITEAEKWASTYDWENDLKVYEKGGSIPLGVFGEN